MRFFPQFFVVSALFMYLAQSVCQHWLLSVLRCCCTCLYAYRFVVVDCLFVHLQAPHWLKRSLNSRRCFAWPVCDSVCCGLVFALTNTDAVADIFKCSKVHWMPMKILPIYIHKPDDRQMPHTASHWINNLPIMSGHVYRVLSVMLSLSILRA